MGHILDSHRSILLELRSRILRGGKDEGSYKLALEARMFWQPMQMCLDLLFSHKEELLCLVLKRDGLSVFDFEVFSLLARRQHLA